MWAMLNSRGMGALISSSALIYCARIGLYNKYNDSIFLIKDHAEWVNFFRHRALKNHRIYLANQEIINSIDNYFDQDTAC